MNSRLQKMISGGVIPNERGIWIDCYNQAVNRECAGTIIAGTNNKGHYWVTDMGKAGNIHNGQSGAVYNTDGVSPTICAGEGVKHNTKILEQQTQNYVVEQRGRGFNKGGKHEICPTISANSFEHNNHVITPINDQEGCSRTIKRQYQQTSRANLERQDALGATGVTDGVRIRKLTPRECFRLMGVSDADIDKIQAAKISKSQQYKMAGNSIVVDCLYHLFRKMFTETQSEDRQLTLF